MWGVVAGSDMPDTAVAPPPPRHVSGGGSGIGQLLRDPEHYEEISVIGNGKYKLKEFNIWTT